jgi:two-component system, chemotaxis family, sensor kinase CheA
LSFLTKNIVRLFNSVVLLCIVVGLGVFTLLIGYYNYQVSMEDLRNKAANTADLAAISLKEPLWNYDDTAMDDIFAAMMLDKDVIAIRVLKNDEEKSIAEKLREGVAAATFDDLLLHSSHINTTADIIREDTPFARVQIVTSSEKVQELIRYTTLLISAFAVVFVVILSGFIWYLGVRIIKKPIDALRASADNLARGHLNETINTQRNDELGSLAVSFDQMRNAIRKKLSDLAALNQAGEQLSGMHNPQDVFALALQVLHHKLTASHATVFLLDAQRQPTMQAQHLADPSPPPELQQNLKNSLHQSIASGALVLTPCVEQTILSVPMMDGQQVYGVMQFAGASKQFSFSAEDEGFALTVARMTVNTLKNIQMVSVIEEQNRTLEERILQRTAELRQKTNDVNSMLQNMRQGIFTIVRGATIHPEYSKFLSEIFETDEVANRPVFPFLFAQSDVAGDLLNQLEATIDSMIGEDAMNFEFNAHLLVHEYARTLANGTVKILELDWNPVINPEGLIDKLMVTVRDVTELKALQRETEKQKVELDIIGQILSISRDKLLEFIQTSFAFLNENEALIRATAHNDAAVVATLFRNMHTIKGNARTYGLSYVTDAVHLAETAYTELLRQPDHVWDAPELLHQLNDARQCIQRYETVFKGKLEGFSTSANAGVDLSLLDNIAQAVDAMHEQTAIDALKKSLTLVRDTIHAAHSESLHEVLRGITDGVPGMARQLNKAVPEVLIKDHAIRIKRSVAPMMRNVFMHIFRNSLDHGLETAAEREAAGKPSSGRIHLDAERNEEFMHITFYDDGRGLALQAIREKAIANGSLDASQTLRDEEIAELIFAPGLSTASEITQVSGRGVGMDAIRKFLNKYGGDVQLVLTHPTQPNGCRPFKMVITLPLSHIV